MTKHSRHYIWVLLFFGILTSTLYWEVIKNPTGLVLSGAKSGGYYSWLFWWWHHAFTSQLTLFQTQHIMFPHGISLFFHAPLNEIPAFLIQLFSTPILATNLILIGNYILAGISSYFLLYKLSKNTWASLCGSFSYAFSTYMIIQHWHGHVIETNIFINPLFVWAGYEFIKKKTQRNFLILMGMTLAMLSAGPYVFFSFGIIFTVGAVFYDVFFGDKKYVKIKPKYPLVLIGIVALAGLFIYWPLFNMSGDWMGGSFFFSTQLLSYFDFPFWHRNEWVQSLRLNGPGGFPETTMGFLGWGTYFVFVILGVKKYWKKKPFQFWIWILLFSAVLSLGPWLHVSEKIQTSVPLPYLILQKIPFLSSFRVSGRILMVTTLAASVLVTLTLSALFKRKEPLMVVGTTLLFLGFGFWERDLGFLGQWVNKATPSPVYQVIQQDLDDFSVLCLPLSYNNSGDIQTFSQYYMLMQTHHQKPMVLGFPGRFPPSALEFTDKTHVIYELTHPWKMAELDENPDLANRRKWLINNGKRVLEENKIKYIVFHPEFQAYRGNIMGVLKTWCDRMFGPPLKIPGDPRSLYQIYS